jgi:N-acetylneuraminic acid mutarotase
MAQNSAADPAGELVHPRYGHTATRLLDGRILAVGGVIDDFYPFSFYSETYEPATKSWSATGNLFHPRAFQATVLLQDGRVLTMGGETLGVGIFSAVEIFDPGTGNWTETNPMLAPRAFFDAVVLANGKVLAAGGLFAGTTTELFDPPTHGWSASGSLAQPRAYGHMTLLDNGKVLMAGGNDYSNGTFIAQSELYDPAAGTWSATGSLNIPRINFVQVKLADGRVLVAGGLLKSSPRHPQVTNTAEIYDPATGLWTLTGSLKTARADFTANLLSSGRVFAAGGDDGTPLALDSIEEFSPANGKWRPLATLLSTSRKFHTSTALSDGSLIVAGGRDTNNEFVPDAELIVRPR